ncbi:MAG: hypothetical protein ACLFR7_01545 [Opitutales bacterium]
MASLRPKGAAFLPRARHLASVVTVATLLRLATGPADLAAGEPAWPPPRNLFGQWLGKSPAEVEAKLAASWEQVFPGDPETARLYYEVGEDMAYIWDVASDWAWWQADPWAVEQSNRVLRFFAPFDEAPPNQFILAGEPLSEESSPGPYAMAATAGAGLAADRALAEPYVARLREQEPATGSYREHDSILSALALLQVAGESRIHAPLLAQ